MACMKTAARQSAACNLQIDYSQVQGARILPFVVALDTENSILQPAAQQKQRFCYQVDGVGEDTSRYADLSHLVLGICDQIAQEDLGAVTVVVDGVVQEVVLGENVEIRTPDQPDPPTGCPGLKFDFGLNKVTGRMLICFELNRVYAVGPIPVCLYGGGVTADSLTICGPTCAQGDSCVAMGYQSMNVCLPVTVTPYARAGVSETYCCGIPTVTPGTATCPGQPLGSCTFTLTQRLCVAVPVSFGANVAVGEGAVQCLDASSANICADCGE